MPKAPSDFDFCPKHKVFFRSCKCKRKGKEEEQEVEEIKDNEK